MLTEKRLIIHPKKGLFKFKKFFLTSFLEFEVKTPINKYKFI